MSMAVLRRMIALLSGLTMLVLFLAESGFACAMPDMAEMGGAVAARHDGGMADMADMAGMQMPASDAPTSDRQPDDVPCRFPWAPSGCRDMAPCAPATVAVAAWQPVASPWAHAAVSGGAVSAPATVDLPPEPPPPRA